MIPHRWFLALTACLLAGSFAFSGAPSEQPAGNKYRLYVGTYTGKTSKGIYRFDFDAADGKLTAQALAAPISNPTFLTLHPSGKFLYAVNEDSNFQKKNTGAVSAFVIDAATGDLKLINQQASEGAGPCHIVVDKAGKFAFAANYGAGTACVLPIEADGSLKPSSSVVKHKVGSGVIKGRQEGPHAHSINLDAAGKFVFVADLGLDQVLVYKLDAEGKLTPNDPPAAAVAPGGGPRHFAFHPNGKAAYVINELNNTVTAFDYDASKGVLKERQSITTLPKDFKGNNSTAEVVVHPSGKFLYGSNRGHNSIAVYRIDDKTGDLTQVQIQNQQIKTPRNFVIDPTGRFLLVANQSGNSISVFRIDGQTAMLTGPAAEVPSPVCLRFLAMK